jgi:uncharacterized protein YbbC (DUF1343 family)
MFAKPARLLLLLLAASPCEHGAPAPAVARPGPAAIVEPPPPIEAAPAAPVPNLAPIEELVSSALAQSKLPGCVVVIGRGSGIVYEKAFGLRQVLPEKEPMTEDTLFDLASLTKPIVTATAIVVLADRHLLGLDDAIVRYLPELFPGERGAITVRQLLTHVSGLPAETPLGDYEHGREEALRRIASARLLAPPGSKFVYSDIGYVVLEEVVRRSTGVDLPAFAYGSIFSPLGMTETTFLPGDALRLRAAPTEVRDGGFIRGDVHDPRAFRLGGVAGHAGLFSTAKDLARYAEMLLSRGSLGGVRVLSPEAVAAMTAPHDVPGGIRALGWDMQTRYSINRGTSLSRRAFGHGGYTGTSMWIDPERDLFIIFLSNRVHPDGKGSINALAGDIATFVGHAFDPSPDASEVALAGAPVKLGVDVLAAEHFARLAGAHVALLTNDTARTGGGARTVEVLAAAPSVSLVALLSPEHGLGADRDQRVADGVDTGSHLPIHSLYGENKAPTPEMLAGVDTIVADLPDAGVRFYTYASTLHQTMRVAARLGLRVVVLDRPNPIDGVDVAGPVLQAAEQSFVNHHPLPIRHGMTMGELAEMINADEHLGLALDVVRMKGYRRAAYFDETGLAFRPPSPNLRTVDEALLYPAVAQVEGTNVSVGRGTDAPFEMLGAPWIDGKKLAAAIATQQLGGLVVSVARFTPNSSAYAGVECQGARLRVVDRAKFEPIRTGIALALALRKLYRDKWNPTRLHEMIGHPGVTAAILDLRPLAQIESLWKEDLDAFQMKRAKYLLYPP